MHGALVPFVGLAMHEHLFYGATGMDTVVAVWQDGQKRKRLGYEQR